VNQAAASIAPALLAWWDRHGRKDLPWQRDPTPYRVWVSEVMLQQTQVTTVERYYDAFIARFPDVRALAESPEDAVLHAWSGLGYYSRARNLQRAARMISENHDGVMPGNIEALMALPGIGRSTAGAILALAMRERHPILDGNVKRVLSRLFRIEGEPAGPETLRELWAIAEACTPRDRAHHYTQAIMDLGATLCTRRTPQCTRCPLAELCLARAAGIAASLPARKPKRLRPQRFAVLMLLRHGQDRVLLEKRPAQGIWGGLWGLPEAASTTEVSTWCVENFGRAPSRVLVRPVLKHGFTHFDLDITPVEADVDPPLRALEQDRWLWYNLREPAEVGLAAPVTKLLRSLTHPT